MSHYANLLRFNFSYICEWENEIKLDFPGGGGGGRLGASQIWL